MDKSHETRLARQNVLNINRTNSQVFLLGTYLALTRQAYNSTSSPVLGLLLISE